MPSPRTRRLLLDHQTLTSRLADWPLIQISGTAGMPPEIYRFTYNLRGLYVAPSGEILERAVHLLEVNLSLGYPRRAPQCRMLTPVFHPNFDESMVCIGDFWAASEGLDDLIIRIGRMITYQEYNTKSPLNGLAAKWAAQNASLLPIDARNISPPAARQPEPADAASTPQAIAAGPSTSVESTAAEGASQAQAAATNQPVSSPEPPPAPPQDPWTEKISLV
jgi:ubiquitin-protein ligase